jgi:transcriptional regulator with XRE-family HTH domain
VADVGEARRRLAVRLRALRMERYASPLTQAQVGAALGASVALLSSWENANAVPPEDRLKNYALLFAPRALPSGEELRLRDAAELSEAEEEARRRLVDELVALRDEAQPPAGKGAGREGDRFWYFPDATQIRIITTRLWPKALAGVPYASPWHPNYLESLWDGDRDSSLELFGHIRAENPTADVRLLTPERANRDDLTGHVVLLGQADDLLTSGASAAPRTRKQTVLEYLARRLELPFGIRVREGGDPEFDSEFLVTVDDAKNPRYYRDDEEPAGIEVYRPVFLRDDSVDGRPRRAVGGYPQLEYDVALLARKPNELNLATTVTICSGIFSRGTYGAVRALTDANLRERNEQYLRKNFDVDDFWLLLQIPVFSGANGAETLTPDLQRPLHRLRSSE